MVSKINKSHNSSLQDFLLSPLATIPCLVELLSSC